MSRCGDPERALYNKLRCLFSSSRSFFFVESPTAFCSARTPLDCCSIAWVRAAALPLPDSSHCF
jgi:hypothetical protein